MLERAMLRRTLYDVCDGYVVGVWPAVIELNRYMVRLRLGPLALAVDRGEDETREEVEQRSEAIRSGWLDRMSDPEYVRQRALGELDGDAR